MMNDKELLRMGRINFLNVLPIYHPLEAGIIQHDFELVSGPPAFLNNLMARGELHISSCSCIEYATKPERYLLVKDLSIGSRGPVMSVMLLSRLPIAKLRNTEILISGQSHTSVALLNILMRKLYKIPASYKVGSVSQALRSENPPLSFLAIGDEALRLRNHPEYPFRVDLAEAWREWTGLPFIFGLWVIDRKTAEKGAFNEDPGELLRRGRDWGLKNIPLIIELTAHGCPLNSDELYKYYTEGLLFTLGDEEILGLNLFYDKLVENGIISKKPVLDFY